MVSECWLTDWPRNERMPFYTRANAGEVLPDPASPLGWTLVFEGGLLRGWLRGLEEFGIYRQGELPYERPPVVGTFGGYFYINLSHCRVMAVRMGMSVEQFDSALLGSASVAPPYEPHPDDANAEQSAKAATVIGEVLAAESFPEIDADLARVRGVRRDRPDLTALTDAELLVRARSFGTELDNAFARRDYSTLGSAVGPAMLADICDVNGPPGALLDIISGLGEVESASPSWGLWDLSRAANDTPAVGVLFDEGPTAVADALTGGGVPEFAAAFEGFLADYGMRGPNEWDIRAQSWEAAPVQALSLVASLRLMPDTNSPDDRHDRIAARREMAVSAIRTAVADDAEQAAAFETALHSTALTIPLREQTKAIAVIVINEIRMAVRELGHRGVRAGVYGQPEDIMMLLDSELDAYIADPAQFSDTIAERLVAYLELFTLEPPFIVGDPPPLTAWQHRTRPLDASAEAGTVLRGTGGSAGSYTGRARVVSDLAAAMTIEPGEIMVAPLTDAAWTPLFLVAGAVVTDVGALNSHAVVVSRELGIPCALSVSDATARLRTGMLLTVDGSAGTVTVDAVAVAVAV